MTEHIKMKLQLLPEQPGCYLMKDKDNNIIYVGKAKVLKNRVRSYFAGSHNLKTTKLVSEIVDFDYIITKSELESLVLECNLIKKHIPKYNIKLIDDKTYPYIVLTDELHPRLIVSRNFNKRKGRYFGPYPNVNDARETVRLLNTIYPLRKCYTIPKKECLYYHMHQCLAPCIHNVDSYAEISDKIISFLKGNTKDVIDILTEKMLQASENLEFEKALEYKKSIESINKVSEKQTINLNDLTDRDIVGYYPNDNELSIQILFMRKGNIVQMEQTIITYIDLEETLINFLYQFYENHLIPKEILINSDIDFTLLSRMLDVKIYSPQKGDKKKICEMAYKNAYENLNKKNLLLQNKVLKTEDAIVELGEILNIKTPRHMEIFDNSNLLGEYPVSSLVVYKNGMPSPSDYRKYNIKTVKGANDYETMKEVVYRRYLRLKMEDKPLPDLIVMDGGIIQVNACLEILSLLNIDLPVIGLKKDSNHKTESIIYQGQEINLDRHSKPYILLYNMQEEVHRFAISFHRSKKAKGMYESLLDGISGVGSVTKKKLLKTFISIDNIKKATYDDFKKIGLSKRVYENVMEKLNKKVDDN